HISLDSLANYLNYTIEFNSNGGSECVSMEVVNGGTYGTLPTPTRTNYTFGGWYKNSDFTGSPVSASDLVTESHTLYAKWDLITYNITITATNGGLVSNSGGSFAINTNLNIIAYSINETAFLYWVRASDGLKIVENPLNEVVSQDETYTAVFGASFEGIAVTSTIGGVAYIVGDNFDNLSNTDTITFATKQCVAGYTFSHWIDLDGNNLGSDMSIRLTKAQVMDNVITAIYVQSANNSINNDLNN
ncbi:MAG: InlB B-repeat-containing protein, partial [Clostridia bacterium]|nr:InlB B-repeat-containing protein [Clostridia bacterium]